MSNNAALLSATLHIEFEVDSYKIARSSYGDLNEFAKIAQTLNGVYIQIEGNTAHVEGSDGVGQVTARQPLLKTVHLKADS